MIASVYLVTGDDYLDDPAWGIEPLRVGEPQEIAMWLQQQPTLETLVISVDGGATVWAVDWLQRFA